MNKSKNYIIKYFLGSCYIIPVFLYSIKLSSIDVFKYIKNIWATILGFYYHLISMINFINMGGVNKWRFYKIAK